MRFILIVTTVILCACQSSDQNKTLSTQGTTASPEQLKSDSKASTQVAPISKSKFKANDQIRASVKENGSWDFITQDGSYVTDEKFTWADNYSCGKACVSKTGTWQNGMIWGATYYFIDKDGKPGKLKFYDQARYHEDRAVIRDLDNKMALIDLHENILVSGFDQIGRISEGLAYATKGNLHGYINKEGQWKFQVDKTIILSQFQNGLAMAKRDGKAGYLNQKGEWQIEPLWDVGTVFNDGRAVVKDDGILSLIDSTGNIIAELDGDYVAGFSDGLCALRKSGKWGYMDIKGDLVIDIKYDNCRMFSDGYAAVWIGDQAGFIDTTGKMIVEPEFKYSFDFKNGLAMVAQDTAIGYIDTSGQFAIPPKYERVHYFEDINETNLVFKGQ